MEEYVESFIRRHLGSIIKDPAEVEKTIEELKQPKNFLFGQDNNYLIQDDNEDDVNNEVE